MIAIILTGGVPAYPGVLPEAAFVVAADSGLDLARRLGVDVDVVVGDMDSVDQRALAEAERRGAVIERRSPDKDQTDLDLALELCASRGATRIIVAGGVGGRLDHLLANALLLASDRWSQIELAWWTGEAEATIVRNKAELAGRPGELISLLPLGGGAVGVRTDGLRWQLAGEDLPAGSTRGVSNEFRESMATIELDSGMLLAVHQKEPT